MSEPQRVQRKRTKGWKMPENTVYVGRGSKWGNPFVVGHMFVINIWAKVTDRHTSERSYGAVTPFMAKHLFEMYLRAGINDKSGKTPVPTMREVVKELRGKNLACWCPLDQPCHADVLLEIANSKRLTPDEFFAMFEDEAKSWEPLSVSEMARRSIEESSSQSPLLKEESK